MSNPAKFRVTAINDLNDIDFLIYLLKYDSAHGK
jgi:glyceraldehyde-3-phosphate dehydrogenase/erythrose-4-phosphate dehydrogenase